jgi:hypothetical protein
MKRRALLFGNTSGLTGVKLDLVNYTKFLLSDFGGQWYDSEISIVLNPSRTELISKISSLKSEYPDFAVVIYSGHGGFQRGTVLEINKNEEYVHESELRNIASRQILIFDCCRQVSNIQISETKTFCKGLLVDNFKVNIRSIYDNRILQSSEQQASLYACSVGESSYDTNDGGIYTNCFLSSIKPERNEQFKLLSLAQEEARPKTRTKAYEIYSKVQTPDQSIPKCLSHQQLIISINPFL